MTTAAVVPLIVAGIGRSGTTALMALLGTDRQIAFDRIYPFENRCLSYIAKLSLVAGRTGLSPFDQAKAVDFDDQDFGPMPWPVASSLMPSLDEWLASTWDLFSQGVHRQDAAYRFYAEKGSYWLASLMRSVCAPCTIHLVRDPRDVWLSIREFAKGRTTVGFGSELDEAEQARHLAHQWLSFAENERADSQRTDAVLLSYEEIASDLSLVAERLNGWLNVSLDPLSSKVTRHFERHATSPSPSKSIGRWKHEGLPAQAASVLLAPLATELLRYGYAPAGVEPAAKLVPSVAWQHSEDAVCSQGEEGLLVTPVGPDAWFVLPSARFDAREVAEVWVCVSGGTGDHFSTYWHAPGDSFAEIRSLRTPYKPGAHKQIVRIPVGRHGLWQGAIEQLRVDVFNGTIDKGRSGNVHWIQLVP